MWAHCQYLRFPPFQTKTNSPNILAPKRKFFSSLSSRSARHTITTLQRSTAHFQTNLFITIRRCSPNFSGGCRFFFFFFFYNWRRAPRTCWPTSALRSQLHCGELEASGRLRRSSNDADGFLNEWRPRSTRYI